MKTILKFVVIVLCFSTMMWADLNEGFDTVLPAGWATSPTNTWFQGNPGVFASHSGAPDSYIASNFVTADSQGVVDNYLFTPETGFYAGAGLSFWTRTEAGSVYPDRLEVLLSTNGSSTSVSDFTVVLAQINWGLTAGGYPEAWTQYLVDLSAYSGSGRIAFHYSIPNTNTAGDYIGIDDVQVVPEPMSCILVGTGLAGMIARRRKLAK